MNRYPGKCRDCGGHVPPGGGNFHLVARGRFEIRCRACINDCNASRVGTYEEWRAARRTASLSSSHSVDGRASMRDALTAQDGPNVL